MSLGAYGKNLGEQLGDPAPSTLGIQLFEKWKIAVTRVTWEQRREGRYSSIMREDAFLVCLELLDVPPHPYWVDEKPINIPTIRSGEFTLLDLRMEHASILGCARDFVATYVPRATLASYAAEHGARGFDTLGISPGVPLNDPVVRYIGMALLPALRQPRLANRLFLDCMALAFITHLVSTYGGASVRPYARRHGGLTLWQQRRATEALLAHINGNIRLEQLSALCGLSRSHFARAFKQSTGMPPHRWLIAQRIERARELLLCSRMTLEDIAERCGFADQAHFSRVFTRSTGEPPGAWRRVRRA